MFRRLTSLIEQGAWGSTEATKLTSEFARLALIARHTSNAVNILDNRGRIEWVNDGFVRMTGYSFEEAKGRVPGSFLRCEHTDPVVGGEIDAAIREGRAIRRELINRGKSGREYWLDVEIEPLFGNDGTLTGFMAIETDISEAKFLQQALTERNADLELMSELAGVGSWRIDIARQSLWWSQQVYKMHEVDDSFQPTITNFIRFFPPAAREKLDSLIKSSIESGARWDVELPLITAKGRETWVRALGRPVLEHGEITGVAGAFQDIATVVAARENLKRTQERLELATVSANIGLWDWHRADNRTWISANWWEHLDYAPDQLPETLAAVEEPIHPDDYERVAAQWQDFIDGKTERFLCEFRLHDAKGGWRWVQSNGRTTKRNRRGAAERASGVFIDIHQAKLADEQRARDQDHLWSLANMDNLTKLPNRGHFFSELDNAIRKAARKQRGLVVGIVDLDRFKEVNDSFGHAIGDELLTKIAQRLRDAARSGDIVARLSGDEFAFFLTDVADPVGVEERLRKLMAAVCDPVHLSNLVKRGGGSIGVAAYPKDAISSNDLLRRADIALYAAKTNGRRGYQWFQPAMEEQVVKGRDARHDFESAIENGEIIAFYQPVISVEGYAINGFEALARWNHPMRGIIGPSDFYSTLLEPELGRLLGTRMRALVFEQIAEWRLAGVPFRQVAFNVVASDFTEGRLAQDVLTAIADGRVLPQDLCVEVTEGVLMDTAGSSIREDLFMLKRAGVEIAFDDFGTGYGSLSHLREYPIDRLKIDRSFVMNLPGSERDLEIVRTIGTLAGALGLQVTAEGVETPEQADLVRAMGATELQGYLFGKPMHPHRVAGFISRFVAGIEAKRKDDADAAGKVTQLATRRA